MNSICIKSSGIKLPIFYKCFEVTADGVGYEGD